MRWFVLQKANMHLLGVREVEYKSHREFGWILVYICKNKGELDLLCEERRKWIESEYYKQIWGSE
jgi:hypothetical protein